MLCKSCSLNCHHSWECSGKREKRSGKGTVRSGEGENCSDNDNIRSDGEKTAQTPALSAQVGRKNPQVALEKTKIGNKTAIDSPSNQLEIVFITISPNF